MPTAGRGVAWLPYHGVKPEALIEDATSQSMPGEALYAAHALLAALHIDIIAEMHASGLSLQAIRQAQAARATAVIDRVRL
jgi:hypothetical protein